MEIASMPPAAPQGGLAARVASAATPGKGDAAAPGSFEDLLRGARGAGPDATMIPGASSAGAGPGADPSSCKATTEGGLPVGDGAQVQVDDRLPERDDAAAAPCPIFVTLTVVQPMPVADGSWLASAGDGSGVGEIRGVSASDSNPSSVSPAFGTYPVGSAEQVAGAPHSVVSRLLSPANQAPSAEVGAAALAVPSAPGHETAPSVRGPMPGREDAANAGPSAEPQVAHLVSELEAAIGSNGEVSRKPTPSEGELGQDMTVSQLHASQAQVDGGGTVSQPSEARPSAHGALAGQIADQARRLEYPRNTHMRVRLHPDELGSVDLRLDLRDGILALEIQASTDHGRGLIEAALPQLRAALGSRGIELGQLAVAPAPPRMEGGRFSDTGQPGSWNSAGWDGRGNNHPPRTPERGGTTQTVATDIWSGTASRNVPGSDHLVDLKV